MNNKNQVKAWLYLLPSIILLLVFTILPFIWVIRYSLLNDFSFATREYNGIGFSNYTNLFKEGSEFLDAFSNTMIAIVIAVPVSLLISLSIAIAMNNIKVLQKFFRTIFFLPFATNAIAIGYVIMIIFLKNDHAVGLFNWFIGLFGVESIDFINGPYIARMSLYIGYIVWRLIPFQIIIIISALHAIKREYYVAARIDGLSRVKQFNKITVPLLAPVLLFLIISGFIIVFKDFDNAISIFGDGRYMDTNFTTLSGFIYNGLKDNTGIASAATVISLVIVVIVTVGLNIVRKAKER